MSTATLTESPTKPANTSSSPVIGIDIGGTNTVSGVVDPKGVIREILSFPTSHHPTLEGFLNQLTQSIQKLRERHPNCSHIGIGAPNGNGARGTIEMAPNLPWKGIIPLAEILETRLGLPVFLNNDANAAALGEWLFGNARGMQDFAMITLGTGLGSGIVCHGKLLEGHDGFAGELGHTIIVPDGRLCGCSRRGCLETYCSVTGLIRTAKALLQNAPESTLQQQPLTGTTIWEAAVKGDPTALTAYRKTAQMLALGIANLHAVTNPQAVILFGGLTRAGEILLAPTRHFLNQYIHNLYKDKVELLLSGLHEGEAALLGAASLAWVS